MSSGRWSPIQPSATLARISSGDQPMERHGGARVALDHHEAPRDCCRQVRRAHGDSRADRVGDAQAGARSAARPALSRAGGARPATSPARAARPSCAAGEERHPAERGAEVAQQLEAERLEQGREQAGPEARWVRQGPAQRAVQMDRPEVEGEVDQRSSARSRRPPARPGRSGPPST